MVTAWDIAADVVDPEIPVLTIEDLGILRRVETDGQRVKVDITPTYSGCPAVETIRSDIETALRAAGYTEIEVQRVLTPAWSTDWMSDDGRRKLAEYGIAPPQPRSHDGDHGPVAIGISVRCPQCGSPSTSELSRFGSTSCKSLWVCQDCREPFDHFKTL